MLVRVFETLYYGAICIPVGIVALFVTEDARVATGVAATYFFLFLATKDKKPKKPV